MLADGSPLMGLPVLADDVENGVLWLAGDESGYMSGLTLTSDAGITTGSVAGATRFAEYKPTQWESDPKGMTA